MLIAALAMQVAAAASTDLVERSARAPVVLPDVQIHFWAEFFRANPMLRARGITFERFLDYQVRNGALFEKTRYTRSKRTSRSTFRPRPRNES